MSKTKRSFILYLDQQDLFNKLPDEVAGKLIKHIFSYVNCENPEADDLLLDVAFSAIKQSLKRDLDKWKSQLKQRSEAGKRSAEKRANEKQRKATTVETRSTKSTDSVNVSVSVSDSEVINKGRFTPPSDIETVAYFESKGSTAKEAEKFWFFYDAKNWMVGKNKMKKWQSAASGWISRNKSNSKDILAASAESNWEDGINDIF
jgi:hypothetical protein